MTPAPITRSRIPGGAGISRASPLPDALAIFAAGIVLMAWDLSGLDLPLEHLYGTAQGFPWRDNWLTAGLFHEGSRSLAWIVFALMLVSVGRPSPFSRVLHRRDHIWAVATVLLCVALIPLLKRTSWTSCPWSLAEFGGGLAPYVSHWAFGQHDGGPGRCFPSGNATTAFGFLAGWFALRDVAPRAARLWLAVLTIAGVSFGWVQMMRGAHFASHAMWTAWISWVVTAVSFHASRGWREGGRHRV